MATHYHTLTIDGTDVFYREDGPADAPVVLLLHGFPSSSRMYRDLIPLLAGQYHVIAPDYPAFGHSGVPSRDAFSYTFDGLAAVTSGLLRRLGVERFALYAMDFGAPVGFRLVLEDPSRLTALILQNAPLYPRRPRAGGPRSAPTGTRTPRPAATPSGPISRWKLSGLSTCTAWPTPR